MQQKNSLTATDIFAWAVNFSAQTFLKGITYWEALKWRVWS